jgi:tetratricopeptide (TPR) repeat protein
MPTLPERRILIRWMFDAVACLLLFGHRFTVYSVLHADYWAGLFFAKRTAGYYFFMAAVYFYILATPLLCWLTASGLKRNKGWCRPVGIFASGLLVLGFPWITIAGAIGLRFFTASSSSAAPPATPATVKPTTDFWLSKRKSKLQPIVMGIVVWVAVFWSSAWFAIHAHRAGMPGLHRGQAYWLWFFLFVLLATSLHESGHALAAWAVGFKLRVISIGPFTFWRDGARFRFRFDLARLFEFGGYMGAVPVSDRNLRWNEIAVIAAGPIANVLTCLVCLDAFFLLPGTAWQQYWWIPALNARLAFALALGNLIPLGYCDGSMLFHLILGTPAGRLLLEHKRIMQIAEDAEACHGRAEFYQEIELHEAMLARAVASGKDNAFTIAACHQALGSGYANVGDWPSAEMHYRKCLEFEGELAANPSLAANTWCGLHLVSCFRHHPAAIGPAYASAVAILEKQKTTGGDLTGPSATFTMLAQIHQHSGAFQTALGEIDRGLKALPPKSDALRRARLLRVQAACRLNLGETDAGLAVAKQAAALYRSAKTADSRRNLGWENVANLGYDLWRAGESTLAVELLREGIAQLESGGAIPVATEYRIKLAGVLRQLGRPQEGFAELPAEPGLAPILKRSLLGERAELNLAAGRPKLAMADGHELVALWRAHPCAPEPEIASAEALLAQALLAAGNLAEAETLALEAADVLGPWQHPDAASCLITVALARSRSGDESASSRIEEAFRLIDKDVLLPGAEKARLREAEERLVGQFTAAVPVAAPALTAPRCGDPHLN